MIDFPQSGNDLDLNARALISGDKALAQHIKQRFAMKKGSFALDVDAGLDFE